MSRFEAFRHLRCAFCLAMALFVAAPIARVLDISALGAKRVNTLQSKTKLKLIRAATLSPLPTIPKDHSRKAVESAASEIHPRSMCSNDAFFIRTVIDDVPTPPPRIAA